MSLSLQTLGIDRLSVEERLDLIGQIWDSLIDSDAELSIPDWHLEELKRRIEDADASPEAAIPWEVVKERLAKRS